MSHSFWSYLQPVLRNYSHELWKVNLLNIYPFSPTLSNHLEIIINLIFWDGDDYFTTQFMLCVSHDSYTATMLPPRVFPYKNSSLKLAKLFFFLFLISSSKRQHSFLKLAKDGFVPWYRYKLVKSNRARSRELAFETLLGNETTESGKTPLTAWYQLQFSIDSAKVFGNQLPNTSLGIILAHSLVQSGYFSTVLKECLVHHKNVPAQEGSFTGYSWQREKRAWGGTNPSLQLISAITPRRNLAGFSSNQLPPADRGATRHILLHRTLLSTESL